MVYVTTDNAGRRLQGKCGMAQQLKTTMFREWDDLVLQKLVTEQVRQSDRAPVALQTYGLKEIRIVFMFLHFFRVINAFRNIPEKW